MKLRKSDVDDLPIPIATTPGVTAQKRYYDDKIKGFEVGADDYLLKPLDIAVLIARIQMILKNRP